MSCLNETPVGVTCPECGRDHEQVNARKQKLSIVIVLALVLALVVFSYFWPDIKASIQNKKELDEWADRMEQYD